MIYLCASLYVLSRLVTVTLFSLKAGSHSNLGERITPHEAG